MEFRKGVKIRMKTINVTFEDEEYETLLKAKKDANWHDFIMRLTKD